MMSRHRLLLCLLLASCSGSDPGTSPPGLTATDRVPRHEVLPLVVVASRGAELRSWVSVYGDCSFHQFVSVQVLIPPRHGAVNLVQGLYHPAYTVPDARSACDQHPSEGIAAFYRPTTGYVGLDRVELLVSTPDGDVSTIDVRLTIT